MNRKKSVGGTKENAHHKQVKRSVCLCLVERLHRSAAELALWVWENSSLAEGLPSDCEVLSSILSTIISK